MLALIAAEAQSGPLPVARTKDWLIDNADAIAQVETSKDGKTLVIENGLIRRTFLLEPNGATTEFDNLMTGESILRAVEPEAQLTLDGKSYDVGGLRGQRDRGYLLPEWAGGLTNTPGSFQLQSVQATNVAMPFGWKRTRRHADLPWPPRGQAVEFRYAGGTPETRGIAVTIRYEIYDGVPVLGKKMTISNGTAAPVMLNRFVLEKLSVVEAESAVDDRQGIAWRTPALDVLSDYMFHGMDLVTGNQVFQWKTDPEYRSQVSYLLKTPCVLEIAPPAGPERVIEPGGSFTTFRSCLVVHDSTERERQGLTLRRVQRALAPWMTESPIMMHVRSAERQAFRNAVDQCAEAGFEMIIYTFGSGLNMENEDPAYIARIGEDVEYAHSKGIQAGAYSLFSSRSIDPKNDVINAGTGKPGGAIFGNAPCFGSEWGIDYYRKLTNFMTQTKLDLLEHDGPYPGDFCASTNHPGHHGLGDSQWVNWRMSADLYAWCREQGIYVNQPDYYFLAGGNKTAMGYREDNWSLPRAQQMIHARQHIYDGTWTKPQTAGWMFVPLTEYHGGGAAATLEPLKEHLDDYEGHLANTLGAGVQACWRGPRLYDSDETKALVKQWVGFFKEHRDILESDIVHGRRPDGRDVDYVVQVNPKLKTRAFAMIHNPLEQEVERVVPLPLYYSGLRDSAAIREKEGPAKVHALDQQGRAWVTVKIPGRSRTWLFVEEPK